MDRKGLASFWRIRDLVRLQDHISLSLSLDSRFFSNPNISILFLYSDTVNDRDNFFSLNFATNVYTLTVFFVRDQKEKRREGARNSTGSKRKDDPLRVEKSENSGRRFPPGHPRSFLDEKLRIYNRAGGWNLGSVVTRGNITPFRRVSTNGRATRQREFFTIYSDTCSCVCKTSSRSRNALVVLFLTIVVFGIILINYCWRLFGVGRRFYIIRVKKTNYPILNAKLHAWFLLERVRDFEFFIRCNYLFPFLFLRRDIRRSAPTLHSNPSSSGILEVFTRVETAYSLFEYKLFDEK